MYNQPAKNKGDDTFHVEGEDHAEARPLTVEEVNAGFEQSAESGAFAETFRDGMAQAMEALRNLADNITPEMLNEILRSEGIAEDESLEGIVVSPDKVKKQAIEAVSEMQQTLEASIQETAAAVEAGDFTKAESLANNLFATVETVGKDQLTADQQKFYENLKETVSKAAMEDDPESKDRLWKTAMFACDFIPFGVGAAKMLGEAVVGKTAGGDDLEGWSRFLHGTEGAVILLLDFTGAGEMVEGGKIVYKGARLTPKLISRAAATCRVLAKGDRASSLFKASQHLFTGAKFIARHPKLAEYSSKGMRAVLRARRARKVEELPKLLQGDDENTVSPTVVLERPGMQLVA